jgi:hypothetical protein
LDVLEAGAHVLASYPSTVLKSQAWNEWVGITDLDEGGELAGLRFGARSRN